MAQKKNAKSHVKPKGTFVLFLFYHMLQVVEMMRSVRPRFSLSDHSELSRVELFHSVLPSPG